VHPAPVLRLKTPHVSTSSACIDDRPWISVSRNTLHTSVHAHASPVSSEHSFMCRRSPNSGSCAVLISPSCLPSSSHLQKPSSPSHSVHVPTTFLFRTASTMFQSTKSSPNRAAHICLLDTYLTLSTISFRSNPPRSCTPME